MRTVLEPARGEERADVLGHPGAVASQQLLAREPARRILGMEVERKPRDLGAVPAPEPGDRRLGRPAERSDEV
jgi:hypothetical protein